MQSTARASSGSVPLRDADGVVSRLAEAWKALKVNDDPVTGAAVQAMEADTPQSKQAFHCDRGVQRACKAATSFGVKNQEVKKVGCPTQNHVCVLEDGTGVIGQTRVHGGHHDRGVDQFSKFSPAARKAIYMLRVAGITPSAIHIALSNRPNT